MQATTGIKPNKRNLLDGIAGRKSRKPPKAPTDKDRYEKTRKTLDSQVKEAKAVGKYRTSLEALEKEAKAHAKQGRHDEALKSLNKLELTTARALDPELAGMVDLLGRDLTTFHGLATSENVKLPPPDDLQTQFAVIGDLIENNNVQGAQNLLTRFKEGVEGARQVLKEVRTELDSYGEPPDSLKTSHAAVNEALDEGDSVKADGAVIAYALALQNTANDLFQKLEALGPPPFDLIAKQAAVAADLDKEDVAAAELGLAAYVRDLKTFQIEQTSIRRELLAGGPAPADLASKHNAITADLEKGTLNGLREKLEDYKKDLDQIAALREELAALGTPPKNFAEPFAAVDALLDRGAIGEAGAALAECRKLLAAQEALRQEFFAIGELPAELAELHMDMMDKIEDGYLDEGRKAIDKFNSEHDIVKERAALREEISALPTPAGKDLAKALQGLFARVSQKAAPEELRKAIAEYKKAVASEKENTDKVREDLTKKVEEAKKLLPEGIDELPSDLASALAAVSKRLEEGSVAGAQAGLEALAKTLEDVAKPDRYTARRAKVGERLENARSSTTVGPKIKTGLEAADGVAGGDKPNFVGALAHLDKTILILATRLKEMRAAFDGLSERGLMVEAFMTRKTMDWYNTGTKDLHKRKEADWLKKAETHLDEFRADVEQAEVKYKAQAPRDPTSLKDLQKVREGYTRGKGTAKDRAGFARNTEQARSLATQVITRDGQVDFGYLAMLPFGGDTNVALLRCEVEGSPDADTAQSRHVSRMLNRLETDKNLRQAIEKVAAPKESDFGPERKADYDRVCNMIRASLGLTKDTVLTDVHARQAATAALFTEIRQVEVGSCFGTAVAIQVQKNKPQMFIKDLEDLFSKGELTRKFTRNGKETTVKIPLNPDLIKDELKSKYTLGAADANLHDTPQFSAALDALGVGATDRKAALDEAQQTLRYIKQVEEALKALPASVTAQTRSEILADTLKARKEGKTLEDILKDKGVKRADRGAVARAFLGVRLTNTTYESTAEEQLAQVVRNRATTVLTDEQVQAALDPAKLAFQAQRDNRLLRAWEYTIASAAAKSPDHPQNKFMREGSKKTVSDMMTDVFDEQFQVLDIFTSSPEKLTAACDLIKAEATKLFDEEMQFNYDASIAHVRPGDGQSSQGGWAMYISGKKIETEQQYKAALKELFAKARANVEQALPPSDPNRAELATVSSAIATHVDDPGFVAKALADTKAKSYTTWAANQVTPWACAGSGYPDQLMEIYVGKPVTFEKRATKPANEEEAVEWLLDMNQKMAPKIKDGVALDPETAAVPLWNGPHAYSFRPGSPLFKKQLETSGTGAQKTSAELLADYKAKAGGRRATAFELKDPPDGMVKKLIDGMVSAKTFMAEHVDSIKTRIAGKLKALAVAEVNAEQIKTALEQAVEEQFTNTAPQWVEYKTQRKASCKTELGKGIQAEILPPVDIADLDPLLDNVMNKVATHLSLPDRSKVKKAATDALGAGGETEASMTKIQKAVFDAIAALPPQDVKFGPRPAVTAEAVLDALKPEGPPGIVFAETNWGWGDQQTLFSMIPDAFTDALEMWSVDENGTMGQRKAKADWVTADWQMATDPDQYGGVAWEEAAPSAYESANS